MISVVNKALTALVAILSVALFLVYSQRVVYLNQLEALRKVEVELNKEMTTLKANLKESNRKLSNYRKLTRVKKEVDNAEEADVNELLDYFNTN